MSDGKKNNNNKIIIIIIIIIIILIILILIIIIIIILKIIKIIIILTIFRRKFQIKVKNEQYNQERTHTREYANFRGFQRKGVLNRDQKDRRSTNSSCNKPGQLRTTNGYGYSHLWNKHANPLRWPCINKLSWSLEIYEPGNIVQQCSSSSLDLLPPRPSKLSLEDEPSMDEMAEALKGMSDWKAVGPDGLPAELLKMDHPSFAQCFHNILVNVWVTGEVLQQWKDAIIKVLHTKGPN